MSIVDIEDVNDLLNFDATKHDDGIKRDQYGRYLLPDPETGEIKPWTRATTLSGILDDTTALGTWSDRNLAFGIGRRGDLFAMAASVATTSEAEDKKCLDTVIASAREAAGQDSKANLGTALHGFSQRYDLGENGIVVPSQWKADIDAYLAGMKDYGLWPFDNFIERVLLIPELETAGTVDRLLCGDGFEDDLPVIGDLKTGKVEGKGRSFAVQLAIYAHATHWYDVKAKTLHEMPKVNQRQGIVIHLPVGKGECHFYEIDIEAGWKAAKLAYRIHKWRKRNDLSAPLSRFESGTTTQGQREKALLDAAHTPPEVVAAQRKAQEVSSVTVTPLDADGNPNGEPVKLDGVKSVEITETKPKRKAAPKKKAVDQNDPQAVRDDLVERAKRGEPMTRKTSKPEKATCVDCSNAIKSNEEHEYVDRETGEIIRPLCKSDYEMRAQPKAAHRTCLTCNEEVAVESYSEHTDAHLFAARFEYAKARVKYVIEQGQGGELGDVWANACSDIPTFKQGGPRTHEEIDRVAGACSLVEMAHSLPFPDITDPAKAKNTTNKWINGGSNQHDQQQQLAGSK